MPPGASGEIDGRLSTNMEVEYLPSQETILSNRTAGNSRRVAQALRRAILGRAGRHGGARRTEHLRLRLTSRAPRPRSSRFPWRHHQADRPIHERAGRGAACAKAIACFARRNRASARTTGPGSRKARGPSRCRVAAAERPTIDRDLLDGERLVQHEGERRARRAARVRTNPRGAPHARAGRDRRRARSCERLSRLRETSEGTFLNRLLRRHDEPRNHASAQRRTQGAVRDFYFFRNFNALSR
jgi:hypothetical protein